MLGLGLVLRLTRGCGVLLMGDTRLGGEFTAAQGGGRALGLTPRCRCRAPSPCLPEACALRPGVCLPLACCGGRGESSLGLL